MKKLVGIFGFLILLIIAVGAYSVVKKQKTEGNSQVLGATQQSFQSFIASVQPAVDQTVNTVSTTANSLSDKYLKDDQKIEVDKAFQDIKNNAADIPENVFNDAKYNYCKQVVTDYESTH